MSEEQIRERVARSFERQGMMKALGFELISVQKGRVEFAVPMSEKVTQQQGAMHGGALGALADISCGYAALTVAPQGMEVASVEYKINFAAAATGERVHCVGEVKRAGRTLAVCQAELFDIKNGERKSCGYMQATIIYVASKLE